MLRRQAEYLNLFFETDDPFLILEDYEPYWDKR